MVEAFILEGKDHKVGRYDLRTVDTERSRCHMLPSFHCIYILCHMMFLRIFLMQHDKKFGVAHGVELNDIMQSACALAGRRFMSLIMEC